MVYNCSLELYFQITENFSNKIKFHTILKNNNKKCLNTERNEPLHPEWYLVADLQLGIQHREIGDFFPKQ